MVDMYHSPVNFYLYFTYIFRHLPIFVDPFSTWIHEVGNLPILPDTRIYLKPYFERDCHSVTTNLIGPDRSDLTQHYTDY